MGKIFSFSNMKQIYAILVVLCVLFVYSADTLLAQSTDSRFFIPEIVYTNLQDLHDLILDEPHEASISLENITSLYVFIPGTHIRILVEEGRFEIRYLEWIQDQFVLRQENGSLTITFEHFYRGTQDSTHGMLQYSTATYFGHIMPRPVQDRNIVYTNGWLHYHLSGVEHEHENIMEIIIPTKDYLDNLQIFSTQSNIYMNDFNIRNVLSIDLRSGVLSMENMIIDGTANFIISDGAFYGNEIIFQSQPSFLISDSNATLTQICFLNIAFDVRNSIVALNTSKNINYFDFHVFMPVISDFKLFLNSEEITMSMSRNKDARYSVILMVNNAYVYINEI